MMMTSKNVSTREVVSGLKYVSTLRRTYLFPKMSFNSALPAQVVELKMYTTFGSPASVVVFVVGKEDACCLVAARDAQRHFLRDDDDDDGK